MLTAVKGYYDGKKIIMDEEDRKNLCAGDEVIVTILGGKNQSKAETRAEKRRKIINSDSYVNFTGRSVQEVDFYIKEMRADDRF
jgi:hypothetical protein